MNTFAEQTHMLKPGLPWWRVPTVWLVIGGPLLVVIASMAMLVVALRGGDAPVRDTAASQNISVSKEAGSMTPAIQARNHAAAPRR